MPRQKLQNYQVLQIVSVIVHVVKTLNQKPTCARTILAPKQRIRTTVEIQRATVWVEERSNHSWYVWKMTINLFPNNIHCWRFWVLSKLRSQAGWSKNIGFMADSAFHKTLVYIPGLASWRRWRQHWASAAGRPRPCPPSSSTWPPWFTFNPWL